MGEPERVELSLAPPGHCDGAARQHVADHQAVGESCAESRNAADDERLVERLRDGDRAAAAILFDRYGDRIERVLVRVLGLDPEIPDLLQDVFVAAITGASAFRGDASTLPAWLTQIAVRSARKCIRRRSTRRALGLVSNHHEAEAVGSDDPEIEATLRCAYRVLAKLPAHERIPFALRFIAGMRLAEVAQACDTSLATVKRRIARARQRFDRLAAHDPLLSSWLEEAQR